MPFSMIGLEPGWQSHSYSCSFCWSGERFPDPDRLIQKAKEKNMQINLWEQAYVHPTAPFYKEIKAYSGDYEVWQGVVPDFASAQAAEIYGRHQEKLISQGIAAVKLDECDGSDYTGNWFFPGLYKVSVRLKWRRGEKLVWRVGDESNSEELSSQEQADLFTDKSKLQLCSPYAICAVQ